MARWISCPWVKHLYEAKSRCNGIYKKYGVHFDLTRDDLEFLWERDKARYLMKPSLDRIDTCGNYNINNCRFIEDVDNKKRIRRKSISSKNKYKGVWWQEDHKKFRSVIRINRKDKHLGYFFDEREAAKAYDNECIKIGELPLNKGRY